MLRAVVCCLVMAGLALPGLVMCADRGAVVCGDADGRGDGPRAVLVDSGWVYVSSMNGVVYEAGGDTSGIPQMTGDHWVLRALKYVGKYLGKLAVRKTVAVTLKQAAEYNPPNDWWKESKW